MAETDPRALVGALVESMRRTADEVVPWFLEQMPRAYFRDTPPETRLAHLSAIVAARSTGLPPSVVFRRPDGGEWTFLLGRDYPGLLRELLKQLPADKPAGGPRSRSPT